MALRAVAEVFLLIVLGVWAAFSLEDLYYEV